MTADPAPNPQTRILARVEIVEETYAGVSQPQHAVRTSMKWGGAKADVMAVSVLLAQYARWLVETAVSARVDEVELEPAPEVESEAVEERAETWRDRYGLGDAAG